MSEPLEHLTRGCAELETLISAYSAQIRALTEDDLQTQAAYDAVIKMRAAAQGLNEAAERLNQWRDRARAAGLERGIAARRRAMVPTPERPVCTVCTLPLVGGECPFCATRATRELGQSARKARV